MVVRNSSQARAYEEGLEVVATGDVCRVNYKGININRSELNGPGPGKPKGGKSKIGGACHVRTVTHSKKRADGRVNSVVQHISVSVVRIRTSW